MSDIFTEIKKIAEKQITFDSIEGNYLLKIADVESGSLTWQLSDVLNQKSLINKQIADLTAQISLYASKKSQYTEQLKSYYKEYLNLKNQRDKLKMQVPVAYLISDSMVKGFNSKGELVIIQDKYGKYVVVEREKYNTTGKTRIGTVYDQNGKTMSFSYNGSNKRTPMMICRELSRRKYLQIRPKCVILMIISAESLRELSRSSAITRWYLPRPSTTMQRAT